MRAIFPRLLIAAFSSLLALLILEAALFPVILMRIPLAFQRDLPAPYRMLAQSSKSHLVPTDFIALFGDSYAQGFGDWLMEGGRWRNGPYQASHVLHNRCGRDVVSLGASGAGSITGWIGAPLGILRFLESTFFYRVSTPSHLLLYFYEGNDLYDNLSDLELRFDPRYERGSLVDEGIFSRFIDEVVLDGEARNSGTGVTPLLNNSIIYQYAARGLSSAWRSERKGNSPFEQSEFVQGVNVARFAAGGKVLPSRLQGPPLDLNSVERDAALKVTELVLGSVKRYFKNVSGTVVYIGAPATLYEFSSSSVRVVDRRGIAREWSQSAIKLVSDQTAAAVNKIATSQGFTFLDTRQRFAAASRKGPVHGPIDWSHFNQHGYATLAEYLAQSVSELRCR